jgi:glutamate-1-semialdehyde 2,1-aminomutase
MSDSSKADFGFNLTSIKESRKVKETEFERSHPKSKQLFERALDVMPGGNTRYQVFFKPFPFYASRGNGSRLFDVDEFEYIDLVNNYSSLIHGHANTSIVGTLSEQVSASTAFGAPSAIEVDLAEVLTKRFTSINALRFTNSGTEAVHYAIRTARAFTKRQDVIKVEGGYSGGVDAVQVSVKKLGAKPTDSVPEYGVPDVQREHTHVIPFNDIEGALKKIREVGSNCACLVIEPIQGSAGTLPADVEYLKEIRKITLELGIVLIFDEVWCARVSFGGAQEIYGIEPDITALGKIIGGGLPVGAFGGRSDIMAVNDQRQSEFVMHAGTFNANPMTLSAGLASMRLLTREKIAEINRRGDYLRNRINEIAVSKGVPLCASGVGSLLQVHTGYSPPKSFREAISRPMDAQGLLFYLMLERGCFLAPGRCTMNISTAMNDDDIAIIESSLLSAFEELQKSVK